LLYYNFEAVEAPTIVKYKYTICIPETVNAIMVLLMMLKNMR